jgi:hypothetical protein
MDTDFTRASRYTHVYWIALHVGSGVWGLVKDSNSLRPHPFIIADLLTPAGQIFIESGVKSR